MTNKIANACCMVIAAWVIAMIGIEAAGHHAPTHTGTQQIHE